MLYVVEFFAGGKYSGRMFVEEMNEKEALSVARHSLYCEGLRQGGAKQGSRQGKGLLLVRLSARPATPEEGRRHAGDFEGLLAS